MAGLDKDPTGTGPRKRLHPAVGPSFRLESLLRLTTDLIFLVTPEGAILESHVPPDNDL